MNLSRESTAGGGRGGGLESAGLTEIPTLRTPVTVSQTLFCEDG